MHVLLVDVFNGCSTSTKEINRKECGKECQTFTIEKN